MDCTTQRGQLFMDGQYETQRILESLGYTILATPALGDQVDCIMGRLIDGVNTVVGIAEIKTRERAGSVKLTKDYLARNGGYLITNQKIEYGRKMSYLFSVPFYVIVRLVHEDVVLYWKMTDTSGNLAFEYTVKQSTTQASCNGGQANRENAYLPIIHSKTLKK